MELEIIQKGDLVTYKNNNWQLVCGSELYPWAVVVSLEPFVLVSENTEMRWETTVEIKDFTVKGRVNDEIYNNCLKRL